MDWTPTVGDEVIVCAGTAEEIVGHVVADFGDEQVHTPAVIPRDTAAMSSP